MKTIISSLLLAACVLVLPVQAVQYAQTYAEAKDMVKDSVYVLFAYADGWDYYSKGVMEKLMQDERIKAAGGDAVFMPLPMPNVLTDELKKTRDGRYGILKFVNDTAPRSYPAIMIFNKHGRHSATIWGPFMRTPDPAEIAPMLQVRIEGVKKQTPLLEQAEKAEGIEKVKLLGEAALIKDVQPPNWPDKMVADFKKLDPQDTTGYQKKLRPPMSFVEEALALEKEPGFEAALSKVNEWINDPAYNDDQRQAFHAIAIGLYHRHGGLKGGKEIRKHAEAMKAINPDNPLAQSAEYAVREWVTSFSLSEGWSPLVLQDFSQPIELEGPLPIGAAGVYKVAFSFTKGRHAACIKAVTLYDGDTKVAEDRHVGRAGIKHANNVYTLTTTAPVKNPRITVEFDQSHDRDASGLCDSYGNVIITH